MHYVREIICHIIVSVMLFTYCDYVHSEDVQCTNDTIIQIQKYLNSFSSLHATFTEYNYNDTGKSEHPIAKHGEIYIKKPNLIKVEYKTPTRISIFVDGDVITYYDHELDEISQIQNNIKTLAFLSKKKIDLRSDFEKVRCRPNSNEFHVELSPKMSSNDDLSVGTRFVISFLKQNFNMSGFFAIENNMITHRIILHKIETNVRIDENILKFKDHKFLDVETEQ